MKKLFAVILAGAMLIPFASCGKTDPTRNPDDNTKKTEEVLTPADTKESDAGESGVDETTNADALVLLPGELYIVGDTPVVKTVCAAGNQAGSTEFNYKDPATKGIRCVFELNEWIEFVLDTDGTDSLKVFAYKHEADARVYLDKTFNEEDAVAFAELNKPETEGESWGDFYIHPDEYPEGIYDIVFVKDGKAVAMMAAKIVGEGAIADKSDDELASMMKSF